MTLFTACLSGRLLSSPAASSARRLPASVSTKCLSLPLRVVDSMNRRSPAKRYLVAPPQTYVQNARAQLCGDVDADAQLARHGVHAHAVAESLRLSVRPPLPV